MKRILQVLILMALGGLLAGCTIFGTNKTPTVEPFSPPPATISLSASTANLAAGDEVTLTGQVAGLGQPEFNLQLAADGAPATYSVRFNETLGEQPPGEATHFVLLSATATGNSVTYQLRALSGGTVTATLSANGEAQGPDGAFFNSNAASQPVTLNIAAPAAQASISASINEIGVNQFVLLEVTSTGISSAQYTVTLTDTADPANTAAVVLGQAQADVPATSLMKVASSAAGADGAGSLILETLGEGVVTASVSASGEVQSGDPPVATTTTVQSDPVTLTISPDFNPAITVTASKTEIDVGDQVTVTAQTKGLGSPLFTLRVTNQQNPSLDPREFQANTGGPDLGPQEVDDRYQLQLVSATASDNSATFVFNASSAGPVEVKVRAVSGGVSQGLGAPSVDFEKVTIVVGGQGGGSGSTYTVKAGDTLWSIARTHGTTMTAIIALNVGQYPILATDINVLKEGWVLNLPAKDSSGGGGTGGPGGTTYTVKAGDNLFRIGLAYDLSWTVLAEANNLKPPYLLKPGDVLIIPAAP